MVKMKVEKTQAFLNMEEKIGVKLNLEYKTSGSLAFDLYSTEDVELEKGYVYLINTGIKVNVPEGYALQILPRSSSIKTGITLQNNVGLIDQDYRLEIKAGVYWNTVGIDPSIYTKGNTYFQKINIGDRIAQALLVKIAIADIEYCEVENDTGRGGFGSTGK